MLRIIFFLVGIAAQLDPSLSKKTANSAICLESLNVPSTEWSPGFSSGNYPFNIAQTWYFVSIPNSCINITFRILDIESSIGCTKDFIAIYDGASIEAPRIAQACGSALKTRIGNFHLSSTRNALTLLFHSDADGSNGRGFEAEIVAYACHRNTATDFSHSSPDSKDWGSRLPKPICAGGLSHHKITQLTSPGFSNGYYRNSIDRSWLVVSSAFTCLQIKLKTIDMEGSPRCIKDYFAIYDGSNSRTHLRQVVCGTYFRHRQLPQPLQSSSNVFFFIFHSDNETATGVGFEAEITVIHCGRKESPPKPKLPLNTPTPRQEIISAYDEKPKCGVPFYDPNEVTSPPVADEHYVVPHSWPWHASIWLRGAHICDGVLISSRHVLSAAHCFKLAAENTPFNYEIRLGKHYKRDDIEEHEQRLTPQQFFYHPNYTRFYSHVNDLAILRVAAPGADLTNFVRPICLTSLGSFPQSGRRCFVVGFGRDDLDLGRDLQQTEVSIRTKVDCSRADPQLTPILSSSSNSIFCGNSRRGCSFCRDGGGIACRLDESWFLGGTLLSGIGWSNDTIPAVFVRTANHISWITKVAFDVNQL